MLQVTYMTAPAPGRVNEDYVAAGPSWVAVLDGATAPGGVDSGCVHDVPWLVSLPGSALAYGLATQMAASLPDVLANAIRVTMKAHEHTCDLSNPDSPSSTVAIIRERAGQLEYLVLCDSPIALQRTDGSLTVVDDDRTDHLPGGRPYPVELVRSLRNQPDGFWVASTRPEAAYEGLFGSVDVATVRGVAMFTDGVTRLIEWYGHTWDDVVTMAASEGPTQLIAKVRNAERTHGTSRSGKLHDDATAVWVLVGADR
ncbi:protein phosphatase 2C domain-containing protein [Streptosporangium roseum]|uniref:protein phosphatase 2C domain-containing protein n=1 Tax=Streptosporangium roseum TaxID=2001 RepID=UPI003321C27C